MKGAELKSPPLPTTLQELGAWQVFADQLTEAGNRLGPYLAYDLSLGQEPTREQLTVFHKMSTRICKVPRQFYAAWMLGQVRALLFTRDASSGVDLLDGDALLTLRDLLPTPPLRHLERLVLAAGEYSMRRRWKAAMPYLPPSCRTLELHSWVQLTDNLPGMFEAIPAQIDVLRVVPRRELDPSVFVNDRFAWVDLRAVTLTPPLARSLAYALRMNSRVKVRVGTMEQRSALGRLGDRVVLGSPDDAALVEESPDGAVSLLERFSPEQLQLRHGIVTARSQLVRDLPEVHRLGKNSRGFGDTSSWVSDVVLKRTHEGWQIVVTGGPAAMPFFELNGVLVGSEPMPLKDGDRLTFDRRSFRFVSRCGERAGG